MESSPWSYLLRLHGFLRPRLSTTIIDAPQKYCRKMDVKFRYGQYWVRNLPYWKANDWSSVQVYLNAAPWRCARDQIAQDLEEYSWSKARTKLLALQHELSNCCFWEGRTLHSKCNVRPVIISWILPELQLLLLTNGDCLANLFKRSSYWIHEYDGSNSRWQWKRKNGRARI